MGVNMPKFISFDEACDLLEIKDFQLIDYLRKGLQPYTSVGTLFNCPDKYHRFKYHRHLILEYERSKQSRKLLSILDLESTDNYPTGSSSPKFTDEKSKRAKPKSPEWTQEISEKEVLENENQISRLKSAGHDLNSWKYLKKDLSNQELLDLLINLAPTYYLYGEAIEHQNQGDTERQNDYKVISMYETAGPQIEKLYSKMLIKFSCWPGDNLEKIREFVIGEFNKDRDAYNLIMPAYLEDNGLYKFRERHAKEDFSGRLFLKIAQDQDLNKKNAQALYKDYLNHKRSTKVEK